MSKNILPLSKLDLKKQATSSSKANNSNKPIEFVIRFTNGSKDLIIPIDNILNLNDLSTQFIRQKIRSNDLVLNKKRLKLIHNGKVLLNHTDFGKELRYLTSQSFDSDEEDNDDHTEPIKIYIHCLIGDELTSEELAKEEELEFQPEKSTSEAPKGFDRLLSQGFSQQDILELRRQFQDIHGSRLNNQSDEALRELEDRWIDSTVNNEIDEFPSNMAVNGGRNTNGILNGASDTDSINTGTNGLNSNANNNNGSGGIRNDGASYNRETNLHKELFIGVSIGYFLGVFALFLLILEDDGIFNKRAKMAVIAGVIVNLCFGILKAWS